MLIPGRLSVAVENCQEIGEDNWLAIHHISQVAIMASGELINNLDTSTLAVLDIGSNNRPCITPNHYIGLSLLSLLIANA